MKNIDKQKIISFLSILLSILIGLVIGGIIIFLCRLIIQIKKNPNLIMNEEDNMPGPVIVIGGVALSKAAVAGIAAGAVGLSAIAAGGAAYGIIRYQEGKKKLHDINEYNEMTTLKEIKGDINNQLNLLGEEFDFTQEAREKIFKKVLSIKKLERRRTELFCQNAQERKKKKLDWDDKLLNKLDLFHFWKSKKQKIQELQNDEMPNLSRIQKNEEQIKNIDEQIKGMREAEKEQIKEVQKCLNALKARYDSIKKHIEYYESERIKLESNDQFKFKTMNFRRAMESSFALLHECMDEKGNPSAEIVCGFVHVIDQTIDEERNRYLVQDGRSYAFTMKAEEIQLKKIEESAHTRFPTFGNVINLEEPPEGFDPKKTILFCSQKRIEDAKKYLKDNHRKINVDGPMRLIRKQIYQLNVTRNKR
jgi:hypothetical protein